MDIKKGFMIYNGYSVPDTCCTEVLFLQQQHPHLRDKHIAFEDATHTYYIKGSSEGYVSVSGLANGYFDAFDAPAVASKMIKRKDFARNSRYVQYQQYATKDKSEEEIVACICNSWAENARVAAALGTKLHRFIELSYNGIEEADEDSPELKYFADFKAKMEATGYQPYRTEFKLYDEEHKVAGMIDMLFYHQESGTFEIFDWKRSKEIKKFGFQKGTGPCAKLYDCNYMHYALQLNGYKWLLERNYGIRVCKMVIVVFHPDNETYLKFELPDMQDIINEILQKRKLSADIIQDQ
jgi:hypothetical protein